MIFGVLVNSVSEIFLSMEGEKIIFQGEKFQGSCTLDEVHGFIRDNFPDHEAFFHLD